jgi:CheY-like chemotaxis protein
VSEGTGRLFLYVEDDALSRQVMQLMVDSALPGVKLVMFDDSREFIPRLRALERHPDIILLDVHLKPIDGFALLAMLRGEAEYRDACVIALTASVMNEEIAQLRTSGFDGAIGKPISVTTFPALVGRILSGEKVWHVT